MTNNKQWGKNKLPIAKKYWDLMWALVTLASICQIPSAVAIPTCTSPMQARVDIVPPSSLNISPSVSVGSVIGTTGVSWPATPASCTLYGTGRVMGVGTPNGNVYPTTISGIGYRAKADVALWPAVLKTYWPTATNDAQYGGTGNFVAGNLTIEFIKTGPISSAGGTFGPGKLGSLYVSNANVAGDYVIYYLSSAMTVKPTTPACTVTSSSITVPLPDTNQALLSTAGSTSASTSFSIPLSCSASTSLSLSFSGDMADSTKGVFKNTNTGNAANVGIQILKDGTPVPTATDDYVNIGSVNGTLNVPLTARYYALTSGVPAGAVNSIAYASIVYN